MRIRLVNYTFKSAYIHTDYEGKKRGKGGKRGRDEDQERIADRQSQIFVGVSLFGHGKRKSNHYNKSLEFYFIIQYSNRNRTQCATPELPYIWLRGSVTSKDHLVYNLVVCESLVCSNGLPIVGDVVYSEPPIEAIIHQFQQLADTRLYVWTNTHPTFPYPANELNINKRSSINHHEEWITWATHLPPPKQSHIPFTRLQLSVTRRA
jgi:hypothetical protein